MPCFLSAISGNLPRFLSTISYVIRTFSTDAELSDLPGGNSKRVPPESISNSVVKTFCADDNAEEFRVKVGTAGHSLSKTITRLHPAHLKCGCYRREQPEDSVR